MEHLSEMDVLELLAIYESSLDLQVQLWISLTFAAIAGSYLARQHLSKAFAHFLTSIYLLATIMVVVRWSLDAYRLTKLIELHPFLLEAFPGWVFLLGPVVWALMTIGTTGCVFCIYFFRKLPSA
jgi:hypothetical protein